MGDAMDTARYWMGVLVVTWLPPALLWWFLIHPFVGFWRKVGPKGTLAVMGVGYVAGIAVLFPMRDALLARDLGTHPLLLVLSALLVGLSFRIAFQRKKQLTTRILTGLPELAPEGQSGSLLTEGIYAHMRHPRYVEIGVGTLGYALFSNWLGALVVGLATLPLLHAIVLLEERELSERFGEEYERYRARVPRYLPRRGRSSAGSTS
jgi:protein-S-isoprenylcysteine O-methyltransferase Ste14